MAVHDEFNAEWQQTLATIFPSGIPETADWTDQGETVQILNTIGSRRNSNHLFFPSGGGLDLSGSRVSDEQGCIELNFGNSASVVLPRSLQFEGFSDDSQASYFRLEIQTLAPSDIYDNVTHDHEELLDLGGATYVDRVAWDRGYLELDENGNEVPIPNGSRIVRRWLKAACFAIFSKGSRYNQDSATYDGRQNRMDRKQFRSHVSGQYRS